MTRLSMPLWLVLGLTGCRACGPPIVELPPAALVASPASLAFPQTYVGQSAVLVLEVSNQGGAAAAFDAQLAAPFSVDAAHLSLARGDVHAVSVSFAPITPGHFAAALQLGTHSVPVDGVAVAVPECTASAVCQDSHFDFAQAQCVQAAQPDATACETSCVVGQCQDGRCEGRFKYCDDDNACTVDSCSEAGGCNHLDVVCARPSSPCQVPVCDAKTGCGSVTAPDGTLCGPDDCLATTVDVCIAGQCAQRVRPDTARCTNRWVPTSVPARASLSMAYDAARQRVVLFGGARDLLNLADTWLWDGSAWTQALPTHSPSPRSGHAMAYDAARHRVVLMGGFDGTSPLADTWTWDGTTWTQASPSTSPPARRGHAMAYDAARQRVVLFGGSNGTALSDTWEWDGTTWTQASSSTSPSARSRHAMAYDAARQRVVLFGGVGGTVAETWEWDGARWARAAPTTSPTAREGHVMAYDAARQRVVLFSGIDFIFGPLLADTWAWDGVSWTQAAPTEAPLGRYGHAMVFDAAGGRFVMFGGSNGGEPFSDTWQYDGSTWTPARSIHPPQRRFSAMATDASQRVVIAGGFAPDNALSPDTWTWEGSRWTKASSAVSPPAVFGHALALDTARQRLVLFGGRDSMGPLSRTWEWDGGGWAEASPSSAPSARSNHALAFDASRQRLVLFGGALGVSVVGDTWEWDGATWTRASLPVAPPARSGHAMVFDASRRRVVLFGGGDNQGPLSDTWEWDGTEWTQAAPATSPPARTGHGLAFDAARQRVVLVGGWDSTQTPLSDTWEWDGADWTQRHPTASPGGGGSAAFFEPKQRVVFFDGITLWVFLP